MRRLGGLLGGKAGEASRSLTALDEPKALQDALDSAFYIMNDEYDKAEEGLSKGTSPFHKLGLAVTIFLRATIGCEKEIMDQAITRLVEAEEAASEGHRRAVRDPSTAHRSKIYPVGAEYALCQAEAQLMTAVIAVLSESLTESLKGFYKVRKAFNALYELSQAEQKYLKAHNSGDGASYRSTLTQRSSDEEAVTESESNRDGSGVLTPTTDMSNDGKDCTDLGGAQESKDDNTTLTKRDAARLPDMDALPVEELNTSKQNNQEAATAVHTATPQLGGGSALTKAHEAMDLRQVTSDPIDLFVHAGTNLCFGLLQLMLSLVPPSMGRILSLFSFRGDRQEGLKMLWVATKFRQNVNGAIAGFIILGYHNVVVGLCDIISSDALPKAELKRLLREMRETYPKSKLWIIEESRMLAADKNLEQAVELMETSEPSSLKQIEAFARFDYSLNLMYLHRYEDCAASFIECTKLNNWSHALYHYIAGACFIELYRMHKETDPDKAKGYAARGEKDLREVPGHVGRRRIMGRQPPFEVFITRKISKWEARAKARGCSLVDAVGVSPVAEMTYLWSGLRRMSKNHVDFVLGRLAWSESALQAGLWKTEAVDEKALQAMLKGACQRFVGSPAKARQILCAEVLCHSLPTVKACDYADSWALPIAHYEIAVCHWDDAQDEPSDKLSLIKCSEELAKVEKWESFDLDARIGTRVVNARETLRRYGINPP